MPDDELLYDDEDLKERLPAFFFDAAYWLANKVTRRMDAEQRGWFIQLLAEAWWNGEPQATLPEDEDELKQLAGCRILEAPNLALVGQVEQEKLVSQKISEESIGKSEKGPVSSQELPVDFQIAERLKVLNRYTERRWAHVRREFVESTEHVGLVHNAHLTSLLAEGRLVARRLKARQAAAAEPVPSPPATPVKALEVTEPPAEVTPTPNATAPVFMLTSLDHDRKNLTARAAEVFEFWKLEMGHPKSLFGSDRKAKVEARLREGYTVEQIKTAIRGCKMTPNNMGDNEHGSVYDDIELICRKSSHVERFINEYNNRSKRGGNSYGRETASQRRARQSAQELEYIEQLRSRGSDPFTGASAVGLKLDPGEFG